MNPKVEMIFEIIINGLKLGLNRMYLIIYNVSVLSRYGVFWVELDRMMR